MRWLALVVAAVFIVACGAADEAGPLQSPESAEPVTPDEQPDDAAERIAYGSDALQFGDLVLPPGDGPFPVVVFVHGGFWRNAFGLELAEPQAADAVANGFATWNIEYRRVGDEGGGYPGTLADVAAAIDHLAELGAAYPLDLARVAVVGHSAGGHLALWAGQRAALPADGVGSMPVVVPALVVGQAPVADLSANGDLGGGAVELFMGARPDDDPAAFAIADPARLLPVRVPQLIVQGADDQIVPADRAVDYAALVDDAERLEIEVFAGADHFSVIDPDHESWRAVLARLVEL